MPSKAFACTLELTVHGVSSIGAQLTTKGDLYIGVTLFGKRRRTSFCDPHFPLCFHERIIFEKNYFSAKDPVDILDKLEDEDLMIELIQTSAVSERDHLLAVYTGDARSFFYPHPSLSPKLTQSRELLMDRTSLFPGVAPKLEFSTYTAIREVTISAADAEREVEIEMASARRKKQSSKSSKKMSNLDQLVNEALRLDKNKVVIDDRPPFVVRHLEPTLTARPPGIEPLGYATEARKRQDIFRKGTARKSKSARAKHAQDADADDGRPSDFLHGYHDDYKHRTNIDGLGNWYPYQEPERLSGYLEDKISGRQYCTVCNLYKRYTGQAYRHHTFRDHVPSLGALSERERESSRLRRSISRTLRQREREHRLDESLSSLEGDSDDEKRSKPRKKCALCRATSASDLRRGARSPTDEISDRVHKALWRDREYEERVSNLISKYDDDRHHGNTLEKLERDIYLSRR